MKLICPTDDPKIRKVWDRRVKDWEGKLQAGDADLLYLYCKTFVEYQNAETKALDATFVLNAKGEMVESPWESRRLKLQKDLLDMQKKLGIY